MMSKTLNLADRVLAMGRNLQEVGCHGDALRILGRLAGWQQLPAAVAEETQARLAEIRLRYHQYAQARRHLEAVLAHQPDNARYHYLLATAFDADERAQAEAAYEHYRRSLELDPNQADCLSDFGLLSLRLGKDEEGLRALRRAVELAPDDPDAVAKLIDGFRRCGRLEEARLTLRAGLFRNPRNYAFHRLWSDFRFQQAREAQQTAQPNGEAPAGTDEPVLLPLLRLAHAGAPMVRDRKRVRPDGASPLAPPHTTRPARVSDRKHA